MLSPLHEDTLSQCYLASLFVFPDSLLLPDSSGKTFLPLSINLCVCVSVRQLWWYKESALYNSASHQEAHSAPSCLWPPLTSWQVSDNLKNQLITLFAQNCCQQTKIIGQWPHDHVFLDISKEMTIHMKYYCETDQTSFYAKDDIDEEACLWVVTW